MAITVLYSVAAASCYANLFPDENDIGADAGDSGDLGRSGGGLASSAAQRGSREGDAGFLLPRHRQDLASVPQEGHTHRGSTAGPQQQQAGMALPREMRPGRVQWAAERGVRPAAVNGRLPQIAEAAGTPHDGLEAQRQLWRQPSGEAPQAAGGLLGRTGLFRSRSSSDREEARASEMSLVKRGASAQQEEHWPQQRSEELAQDDAHRQQEEFAAEQVFGRGLDPLGAGYQGHLAPDVPSWAQ